MSILMKDLYISKDKEVIMRVLEVINDKAFGYNMRNEEFISINIFELKSISYDTIFKYIGFNDYKLIGILCDYFMSDGVSCENLANAIGVSKRTIFRYIKDNLVTN